MPQLSRLSSRLICLLCTLCLSCILVLNLFVSAQISYCYKQVFLLPQTLLLILGLAIAAGIFRFFAAAFLHPVRLLETVLLGAGLFVLQATLCYYSYFLTGWDPEWILGDAYGIGLYGASYRPNLYYFSCYPNNALLTLLMSRIIWIFHAVVGGEPSLERCAFIVILVQCALNTLTGMLVFDLVRQRQGPASARAAFFLYVLLIGLSPWSEIPYSDGATLVIPVLSLRLSYNLLEKESRPSIPSFALLGLLFALGFRIKPHATIAILAILMTVSLRDLAHQRPGRMAIRLLSFGLSCLLFLGPVYQGILHLFSFNLDPEMAFGLPHFLMVGLNEGTNGVYSDNDQQISEQAPTRADRTAQNLEVVRERLCHMGLSGLGRHAVKKALTNFDDGSFAWGKEGMFFSVPVEDKDSLISPFLKRLINPEKDGGYPLLLTFWQGLWLALLGLCLLCALRQTRLARQDWFTLSLLLSLLGLILFQMLFEARARYLYIYSPVFLLTACEGLHPLVSRQGT